MPPKLTEGYSAISRYQISSHLQQYYFRLAYTFLPRLVSIDKISTQIHMLSLQSDDLNYDFCLVGNNVVVLINFKRLISMVTRVFLKLICMVPRVFLEIISIVHCVFLK